MQSDKILHSDTISMMIIYWKKRRLLKKKTTTHVNLYNENVNLCLNIICCCFVSVVCEFECEIIIRYNDNLATSIFSLVKFNKVLVIIL